MKKVLIGLAVIAVVGVACIPYFVGKAAQDNITDIVSTSNSLHAGTGGKTDIISYDRGWRSSKSHYKWTLPAPYSEEITAIEFHCEATHGLSSYQYECLLDQSGDYGKFITENLDGVDPLSLTGSVDMAGNSHNNVTIDPFTIDKNGETIKVEKANAIIDSDAEFINITTTGSFDGASFDLSESSAVVGKLEFDADIEMFKGAIALGKTNATVSSLDIKDSEMSATLDQFSIKSDATQNDNNLASITNVSIDKIDINAAGDQHVVDNIASTINIAGLNADALIELTETLNTLQDTSEENAQAFGEAYTLLSEKIEALLLPGLSLGYDIEGNYNNGKVSLDIGTNVLSALSLQDATIMLFDPESVLDKLAIDITSVIPTSVIDVDPSIAATLDGSGLFTQTDEGYAIDLKLNKEGSTLNGQDTSISDLMGLFM